MTVADHTILTDSDIEPVDEARLQAAIAAVCAMTEDEFCDAAEEIGLDIWSGMSNGSKASRRRRFQSS